MPTKQIPYVINWNDNYREEIPINTTADLANIYNTIYYKLNEAGLIPIDVEFWKENLYCYGKTEFRTSDDKFSFLVELDSTAKYVKVTRKYGFRYVIAESISDSRKYSKNLDRTIERMRRRREEVYYGFRNESITPESLGKVKIVHTLGSYVLFSNGEVYFLFQKLPD